MDDAISVDMQWKRTGDDARFVEVVCFDAIPGNGGREVGREPLLSHK